MGYLKYAETLKFLWMFHGWPTKNLKFTWMEFLSLPVLTDKIKEKFGHKFFTLGNVCAFLWKPFVSLKVELITRCVFSFLVWFTFVITYDKHPPFWFASLHIIRRFSVEFGCSEPFKHCNHFWLVHCWNWYLTCARVWSSSKAPVRILRPCRRPIRLMKDKNFISNLGNLVVLHS